MTRRNLSLLLKIWVALSFLILIALAIPGYSFLDNVNGGFLFTLNFALGLVLFGIVVSTRYFTPPEEVIVYEKTKEGLETYIRDLQKKLSATIDELEIDKATLEEQVAERTTALNNERLNLEAKVKERTAELEAKVAELQDFFNAAVGRELKMIELEKEIEKLKCQLGTESAI